MSTQRRLATHGIVLALTLFATAAFAGLVTEQVDVTGSGAWPNGGGWYPSMSADGRYTAFHSWASNLVPGDLNWRYDIFVRDRLVGITRLVSLSESGQQADQDCLRPSLSADGSAVAFASAATTLVPTDTLGKSQIYLVQWQTGHIELVSLNSEGEVADGDCDWASVSGDGRYVAFQSAATNLTPEYNGQTQVYVRDRLLGTTVCASRSSTGDLSSLEALKPRLTPDGRYVLFCAYAGNLVPGDTNNDKDIFLRDLQAETTECISVSYLTGLPASGRSPAVPQPAITPDGRYVAFTSNAPDIVPDDTNGTYDAFLRDRLLGTTELVSVNDAGQQGNRQSGRLDESNQVGGTLAISADGRYVAFGSVATNLILSDTNAQRDVFIRDRVNHTTTLASVSTAGAQGNGLSGFAGLAMSWDGSVLAFDSQATNLVPGDTDTATTLHAYLRAAATPTSAPTCEVNGGATVTTSPNVTLTISANGWSFLRFRNEFGNWTGWGAAAPTRAWTLSAGDGVKLVSVQGGNKSTPDVTSAVTSAAITLDTVIPSVTLTINGGAAATDSPVVTLTLTGSDAAQMHFRNETGNWPDWEPFATTKQWTLSDGDGLKTVAVQVKDLDGAVSAEVPAQITLDTTPPGGLGLLIDGGAAQTLNREVTLTLAAAGAAEMRFHNENEDWSAWQRFATTAQWRLSEARGVKQVSFQAQDAAGNQSDVVSAQIVLANFSDVPSDFWAYDEIIACVHAGVVGGYPDGTYRPGDAVTRDQMAVYIARALAGGDSGIPTAPAEASFGDVPTTYWAFQYIEYAKAQGIVTGYPDGYHPTDKVTRDQMAVYIARSVVRPLGEIGLSHYDPPSTPSFPDVGTDFWAYRYIEYVKSRTIVQGYPDGTYQPSVVVTRDQMAVYVARAFQLPM